MEGYNNSGGYDDYLPAIYGANSMTAEEMSWLAADIATVPQGSWALAFIHYDFSSSSRTDRARARRRDLGHNHSVSEGNLSAWPFNLGLKSCIYSGYGSGGRAFRIIRVFNGGMQPGPMHFSGAPPARPPTRSPWPGAAQRRHALGPLGDHHQPLPRALELRAAGLPPVDHDSTYAVSGGVLKQVVRTGGRATVYVECSVPSAGTLTVSVNPAGPVAVEQSRRPRCVSIRRARTRTARGS